MSAPQYTTVSQLIIALQAAPPDAVVDHDGLSYEPDTPVRGDVVPGDGGVKCVVLYPKA